IGLLHLVDARGAALPGEYIDHAGRVVRVHLAAPSLDKYLHCHERISWSFRVKQAGGMGAKIISRTSRPTVPCTVPMMRVHGPVGKFRGRPARLPSAGSGMRCCPLTPPDA